MVAAVAKTAQEYVSNFALDFSAYYVCLLSVSREKSQGTNDLIVHGATSYKHESTAQEVNLFDQLMYIVVIPFIKVRTKIFSATLYSYRDQTF